jgi:transcriptional regulator of met regulon
MKSFDQLAKIAYDAYCKQAGGKTFDGKPLPTFDELGAERQSCWIAAAKQLWSEFSVIH